MTMCEQTPVEYKDGDVVWVKLGSCWWPGEVQDLHKVSEETLAAFKKPIIAAVKFFDEDYYEYIKSLDRIYSYNCSKKNEFIKKGLDLHRAKHDYMKKFPEDVSKAEARTNGNPNILEDPIFAAEKKTNIAAIIFGTPKQKKSPKKSSSIRKSVGSRSSTDSPKSTTNKVITHPRFLGQDDHEVRILVQSPEQDQPELDEEIVTYKCIACGFTTQRIDVSITHHKSHIQGNYATPLTTPKKTKRPHAKKSKVLKMTKSKTSSITEDLDLIDKGIFFQNESSENDTIGSSCESEPETKRRKKKGKKKVVAKKEETKKPTTVIDIRGDLLAEWDDESDAEKDETLNLTSTPSDLDLTITEKINSEEKEEEVKENVEKIETDAKKEDKSCFDFEEEEESEIVGASLGRKIPRVIPPPDRQKSPEIEETENELPETKTDSTLIPPKSVNDGAVIEDSSNTEQTTLVAEKSVEVSVPENNETDALTTSQSDDNKVMGENQNITEDNNFEEQEKLDEAFRDILEATAVPELPEIPHALKFEQNFHDSKKIKFPDKSTVDNIAKPEVKEPETTPKLINPKKRFVKSFEDFEQQIYNEQRRLLECEQKKKKESQVVADKPDNKSNVVVMDLPEKVKEPDVVATDLPEKVKEPDLVVTDLPEIVKEPEVVVTDLPEKVKEPDLVMTDLPEKVKEPEVVVTDLPEKVMESDIVVTDLPEKVTESVVVVTDLPEKVTESVVVATDLPEKVMESDIVVTDLPENVIESDVVTNLPEKVTESVVIVTDLPEKVTESVVVATDLPENVIESDVVTDSPEKVTESVVVVTDLPEKVTESVVVATDLPQKVVRYVPEKVIEPPTVEVSKLKTQLMFKLGNAEARSQHSKEHTSRKEYEYFRHSHSCSLPKRSRLSEFYSSRNLGLNVIGPPSPARMCEVPPEELLETNDNLLGNNAQSNLLEVDENSERRKNDHFTVLSPVPAEVPDIIEKQDYSIEEKQYNFKRRFSVKMSEFTETKPMEMKEVTELLGLGPKVQLEPTQVLEDKSTEEPMDMLQVEDIVETQTEVSDVVNTHGHLLEENVKMVEEQTVAEEPMDTSPIVQESIKMRDENNTDTRQVTSDLSAPVEPCVSFSCTNLNSQNAEDLSALTTLAAVSELSTNLDMHCTSSSEKSKIIEDNLTSCVDKSNLNFVTMDDLAEGQVEISNTIISKVKSKPINLMSFSVDYQDSNDGIDVSARTSTSVLLPQKQEHIHQPDLIEMSLGKVFEDENSQEMVKSDYTESIDPNSFDLEDQIPSLLVCGTKAHPKKLKMKILERSRMEYSSSSKLLEILTDGKTSKPTFGLDASQKSPNTWKREERGHILQKDKTTSSKPKEDKLFNILRESSPATKMLPKNKEERLSTVTKEVPMLTKVVPKGKDDKLYTITKESPITKTLPKYENKHSKFILKSTPALKSYTSSTTKNKPIILSEKIIKTLSEPSETVSVQKVTSKRSTQDVEDIDTFIIQKPPKKIMLQEDHEERLPKKSVVPKGKAKILQQTIIKPGGDIVQPATTTIDDGMFDINSMPIVLGDQILTTDGIENMPVVIETSEPTPSPVTKPQSEQRILLNKTSAPPPVLLKTYSSQKMGKSRIYQTTPTSTTKILKTNPTIISRPGKQDKYVILPSTTTTPTTSKYTVGKKQNLAKRMTPVILPTPNIGQKIQTTSSEPSGNKIMIVTNQQGQQSRVLLTPAQQKLLGYQSPGSKLVKSTLKGNILQKTNSKTSVLSTVSNVQPKSVISQETIVSTASLSTEPVLMPIKNTSLRNVKSLPPKTGKFQIQSQKISLPEPFKGQQKTIVIKNQQGQIVKKFHGTDDAFLEQQVAEQVQAIKASGSFNSLSKIRPPLKRSYKKPETQKNLKLITTTTSKCLKNETVPPLAPISPKKTDPLLLQQTVLKTTESKVETIKAEPQQKPLNQLIIQDALGNQTTIMEGQILALPSGETIDGQPQSYMLVTLDESGNLTPLNNEALLSLDPNLSLGGDLSNMVLQLDDGANKKVSTDLSSANRTENIGSIKVEESPQIKEEIVEAPKLESESSRVDPQNVQTVTCSIGNDPNQQLIITGDPISTQKFIESLTEGNPDLANLLASAEGNILIQTDEQQILINTESENQVLLPLNAGVVESNESDGNPIFATQPLKNQDILAAALADTDVFQQEQTVSPVLNKMAQSQLSPNSGLYQPGVSNVLETTLSLSSPIMTPLEVPSTNSKKIPDEMDILTTEVPKNVDLPITITDPNISQTVAQQQIVSLIATDLPLSIAESVITPLTSAEMNSPSFSFSLDESVANMDVQKSFSGPISMPLLTEDPQETITDTIAEESEVPPEQIIEAKHDETIKLEVILKDEPPSSPETEGGEKRDLFESSDLTDSIIKDDAKSPSKSFLGTTIETEEGLCTLGGAMCSSLSEPPPDMFDLSLVGSHYVTDTEIKSSISSSIRSEGSPVHEQSDGISQDGSTNEMSEGSDAFNKFETYGVESKIENNSILNAPENSNSSSPVVNVDENSCEIPVQPQIVTDLSSTSFECMDVEDYESNKRVDSDYDTESDRKKIEFD